jgi:hypothetical protein
VSSRPTGAIKLMEYSGESMNLIIRLAVIALSFTLFFGLSLPSAAQTAPAPAAADTVVFQDDFESGTLAKWDGVHSRYSVTSDSTKVFSGSRALDMFFSSSVRSGSLDKWFMPGYDEIYIRFNLMFETGFQDPGMHFFFMGGNDINNKWSSVGQAGVQPTGYNFFNTGLDSPPLSFYTNYPDMTCLRVPDQCWGTQFVQSSPAIYATPGRWQEIVVRLKANTVTSSGVVKDGAQSLWIDGAKKIDVQNLRWRDTTNLRLNQTSFFNYMPNCARTQHAYVDNFIVWKPGATSTVDTAPPVVSILSPANGAIISR